jgi:hypothetical protein
MTQYVCIDNSSSTAHNEYWEQAVTICKRFPPETSFWLWNSTFRATDFNEIVKNRRSLAYGCTNIDTVADITKEHKPEDNLVIITDGEVDLYSVANCASKIKEKKWGLVQVFFINEDSDIDVSVCAPFISGNNYEFYTDAEKHPICTKHAIPLLERGYESDPERFLTDFEALRQELFVSHVADGSALGATRDKLLELQKNMLSFLQKTKKPKDPSRKKTMKEFITEWRKLVYNPPDYQQHYAQDAIDYVVAFRDDVFNLEQSLEIEESIVVCIKKLIETCDAALKTFSLPTHTKFDRTQAAEEQDIDEMPLLNDEWECPITMEEDEVICVLVPSANRGLCKHLSKKQLDLVVRNPLRLSLECSIEGKSPVGLEACKNIVGKPSPYTRDPISMAFVLYQGDDPEKAAKVHALNDWVLAKIVFDGKMICQMDLLLCGFFFDVVEKNLFCQEVIDAFWVYIRKRVQLRKTNLALSGLPIKPFVRVPVDFALWYQFFTEDIYAGTALQSTNTNRLRHRMLEEAGLFGDRFFALCPKLFGVTISQLTSARAFRYSLHASRTVLARVRRGQPVPASNNQAEVLERLGLYYKSFGVLFEHKSHQNELRAQLINGLMLMGNFDAIDRAKKPQSVTFLHHKDPLQIWYYHYPVDYDPSPVQVSLKTCRPISSEDWKQKMKDAIGAEPHQVLSLHRYYAEMIIKYPDLYLVALESEVLVQLARYAHNAQMRKGIPVLPSCFFELANAVLRDYAECVKKYSHDEFKKKYRASYDKTKRMEMENS